MGRQTHVEECRADGVQQEVGDEGRHAGDLRPWQDVGVQEDHRPPLIERGQQRAELRLAPVLAALVAEQDDAVRVQGVQRVDRLRYGGVEVCSRGGRSHG